MAQAWEGRKPLFVFSQVSHSAWNPTIWVTTLEEGADTLKPIKGSAYYAAPQLGTLAPLSLPGDESGFSLKLQLYELSCLVLSHLDPPTFQPVIEDTGISAAFLHGEEFWNRSSMRVSKLQVCGAYRAAFLASLQRIFASLFQVSRPRPLSTHPTPHSLPRPHGSRALAPWLPSVLPYASNPQAIPNLCQMVRVYAQ